MTRSSSDICPGIPYCKRYILPSSAPAGALPTIILYSLLVVKSARLASQALRKLTIISLYRLCTDEQSHGSLPPSRAPKHGHTPQRPQPPVALDHPLVICFAQVVELFRGRIIEPYIYSTVHALVDDTTNPVADTDTRMTFGHWLRKRKNIY